MKNVTTRIMVGIMVGVMSSCSPQFHLDKFYKKGGKIEQVTKTVTLTDTVTINGKDSIIYRKVNIDCPEPIIETRWKVRFDNKRFKDSLNSVRTQYKDSLRFALKTYKNELKTEVKTVKSNDKTKRTVTRQENKRSIWLFWLGLAVGVIIMLLIKLGIKYLKTFLLK
jgi:hypothetical protein